MVGLLKVKWNNCLRTFILFLFINGIPIALSAQSPYISKDSLSFNFSENWKFYPGDSAAMSTLNYDDSHWDTISSKLYIELTKSFKGIAWFRYHFISDSSIVERPLALTMNQTGASEIYVDGKLVKSYGTIKDSIGCVYYNPQELPFIMTLDNRKEHVIAVRYVNYDVVYNSRNYNR